MSRHTTEQVAGNSCALCAAEQTATALCMGRSITRSIVRGSCLSSPCCLCAPTVLSQPQHRAPRPPSLLAAVCSQSNLVVPEALLHLKALHQKVAHTTHKQASRTCTLLLLSLNASCASDPLLDGRRCCCSRWPALSSAVPRCAGCSWSCLLDEHVPPHTPTPAPAGCPMNSSRMLRASGWLGDPAARPLRSRNGTSCRGGMASGALPAAALQAICGLDTALKKGNTCSSLLSAFSCWFCSRTTRSHAPSPPPGDDQRGGGWMSVGPSTIMWSPPCSEWRIAWARAERT